MIPTITPYLLYQDCAAALDFLSSAFGFEEQLRSIAPDGKTVWHAEMKLGDGSIMMGTPPDYRNPKELGGVTVGIHVYVDDVDAHFEHAKAAGAEILEEPGDQDYGDRRYTTRDPEGHHWYFATHIKDVAAEEWGAQVPERASSG